VVAQADHAVEGQAGGDQDEPGEEHRSHAQQSFPLGASLIGAGWGVPAKPLFPIGFLGIPPDWVGNKALS
jgi:hypothetical protein